MNITFQTLAGQKAVQNQSLSGMDAPAPKSTRTTSNSLNDSSTYAVELDSSFFGNDAYGRKGKTAEDLSQMAQNTDVLTQHNYRALLSNTLSAEDYQKACEDGFDLKNFDPSETVTIVDKIKSVLLESGTTIVGYNDDLDINKLTRITGSQSFAQAIQKSFHENDVPVTAENVKTAKTAYEEVKDMEGLSDSAVKFMVLNNMEPTIENLYFAAHSTNGVDRAQRGFYAQEMGGYYAQKSELYDWQQLEPQIKKVIEEAGLDAEDQEVWNDSRWLVEQGVPLTAENLSRTERIKSLEMPVTPENAAASIAAAISDGRSARHADLIKVESNFAKAINLERVTKEIETEDIKRAIAYGKEINIKNLSYETQARLGGAAFDTGIDDRNPTLIQNRILLEEVRMKMTVEANHQLLNSGFSIDTAPMQELIDRLKGVLGTMADEAAGNSVDEITGVSVESTVMTVSLIKAGPIAVSGVIADRIEMASLQEISVSSQKLAQKYQQAGEAYEPLMTEVRADLGDNIKKAFRNVDQLLEENKLEVTEDNQRAVRILGYNSMEITAENIEKVKSADQTLKATLERLKPGAVLDLIRDGQNPLSMTLEELGEALDKNDFKDNNENGRGSDKNSEKYSRFIYKLEKQKGITAEEKTSFIGIYRLFETLKREDYQAIGSVLKTGRDMTLENLLSATRTRKASASGIDFSIDDEFGGIKTNDDAFAKKIDEQINLAFRYYSAKADIVYENLEPEKLSQVKPNEQTLLNELADKLENAKTDEELDREFYRQQVNEIRDVASSRAADGAVDELRALNIEASFNNLEAMIAVRRDRRAGSIWDKTRDVGDEEIEREQSVLANALEEPDYEETYKRSLDKISEKLSEVLETSEESYIDVKSITLMQKQLSVMSQSSDRGSFEVPVEIDGQKISMHVTLKSDDSKKSRMEASIQTYEYGLITATLYTEGDMISGILSTTNYQSTEEAEYLETVRSKLCDKLAEKIREFGVGQDRIAILYHAQIQPAGAGTASAIATEGSTKNITETGTLLKMAKAFIEAL